jgi:hypothetical protein
MSRPLNAQAVINSVHSNGGLTLDVNLKVRVYDVGYQVSLKGYETRVSENLFNNVEYIDSLLRSYQDFLDEEDTEPNPQSIGIWKDQGFVYFDVSFYTQDKDKALEIAKVYQQKAIWDWAEQRTIEL